jgi:hypothetical protein
VRVGQSSPLVGALSTASVSDGRIRDIIAHLNTTFNTRQLQLTRYTKGKCLVSEERILYKKPKAKMRHPRSTQRSDIMPNESQALSH